MNQFETWLTSTGEHNLSKDDNGKYLLNTVQLAWEAWQAGYEHAKEEQDSNLTCDHCCNELGIDDGSIRLCGECKGKEKHYETQIYSGEDLPPANTPVLALVIDHEDPLLVGYCDEERKWYFHDRCEYFDCDTYVQRWCYLPDFSKKTTAKNDETLTCNHCNISVDYHPWHHSIGNNSHVHLCNECHEKHINLWISVKDRLPNKDGNYLVWRDNKITSVSSYATNYGFDSEPEFYSKEITHWQPLPEPPTE